LAADITGSGRGNLVAIATEFRFDAISAITPVRQRVQALETATRS
jgi:hypothetical protein